jgi:Zn-dependent protease with chaperone function
MNARYADGRAAILHPASAEFGAEAVRFSVNGVVHDWPYAALRRADDDNGHIMLKRTPETGERLILDESAREALKTAAPTLFQAKAHGVESPALVGALAGAAAVLALVFLVGVPMAAEPIAHALPERYAVQVAGIARSQMESITEYCAGTDQAELALDNLVLRFLDESPSREDDALRSRVMVTIVQAPFPNAFAMPDDSIIVTDQLIAAAESPDELAGVLAHELAHIANDHVMANVIRNTGAGVFFDVVFGGAGLGQAAAIASVNLASLRYSRDDEAEADHVALDYLDASHIDPGAFARFFDRIAAMTHENEGVRFPTMLSSHPPSAQRAAAARARAHAGQPALNAYEWQAVRSACVQGNGAAAEPAPPQIPSPPPPKPAPLPNKPGKPS